MIYIGLIIGLGLLLWMFIPLYRTSGIWLSLENEKDILEDRKERVYRNIADLEFDYAMGRLSDADFKKIRSSFILEAGHVVEAINMMESPELNAKINEDLNRIRTSTSTIQQEVICPRCKSSNPGTAQFCMSCGEVLK